jgi:hypothetical protein
MVRYMHRVIHQNEEFLFLNIDVPKHTTLKLFNKSILNLPQEKNEYFYKFQCHRLEQE